MSAEALLGPCATGVCPACEGTGTLVREMAQSNPGPAHSSRAVSRCGACKGSGRPSPLDEDLAGATAGGGDAAVP